MIDLICSVCGIGYTRYPSDIKHNKTSFCSRPCSYIGKPRREARPSDTESIRAQFWQLVDKSPGQGPEGTCWLWAGTKRTDGYGDLKVQVSRYRQKALSAHRLSVEISENRELSSLEHVCHKCDTPPCVNPKHLFIGTIRDNIKDMCEKGRHWSKLTKEDVEFIRNHPELSGSKLGKLFGISERHANAVRTGKWWKV